MSLAFVHFKVVHVGVRHCFHNVYSLERLNSNSWRRIGKDKNVLNIQNQTMDEIVLT